MRLPPTSPNWIRWKNRGRRRNAEYHKQRSNPVPFLIGAMIGIVILVIGILMF